MKIGITTAGNNLESAVDPRFGRCAYFLLVDPETQEYKALINPGTTAGGGAGIKAAQFIMKQGVRVLITGQCGPNARDVLTAGGVRIYQAPEGKVSEAVNLYQGGELKEINSPGRPNRGRGSR